MRYLMNISYDGSNFYGFQKQPNKKTIQGEIEKAIKRSFNQDLIIHGAGRTDAKVHAIDQYAHFDMKLNINTERMKKALNKELQPYIYIKSITIVDEQFHARYNVVEKEYQYLINVGEYNPLQTNYCLQHNQELNIQKMESSVKCLIGMHDFKSFATNQLEKENHIRNIFDIKIEQKENQIVLTFRGNGFLKHMIRNIVGCLIDIGSEKKDISYLENILNEKTPRLSKTAPGEGLYLTKIKY